MAFNNKENINPHIQKLNALNYKHYTIKMIKNSMNYEQNNIDKIQKWYTDLSPIT